jgi:DNA-nicking Smr family endonuclease
VKTLSPDERALWARVIASVEPLKGRVSQSSFVSSEVEKRSASKSEPTTAPVTETRGSGAKRFSTSLETNRKKQGAPKPPPNTLDGSWDRRLARGLVAPDLAVDLHGHTLDSAYRELDAGLAEAIGRGARVLLLVTGKPRAPGSGRGAIRAAVGDWLAASRHADAIAAVRNAHPRHGGAGALYIILRRPRA